MQVLKSYLRLPCRGEVCHYNDTYLLLNVTLTVVGQGVNDVERVGIKISGRVLQDHKVVPSKSITNSELFKFKSNLTNNTGNASTVNAEIAVS